MSELLTPNTFFDQVFCLNLDRRSDRWEEVNGRFKRENISVTRFSATDKLTNEVRYDYGLLLQEKKHTSIKNVSGYAILLSYIKLFHHIKREKYDKVLIFEDDVTFINNFDAQFAKSVQNLPKDWEMWSLGVSQYGVKGLTYTNDYMFFSPTSPNITYGLFAFAITKEYVNIVLDNLEKRLNYADVDIYHQKYDGKSRIYISCPPICGHAGGWSDNVNTNVGEINILNCCPDNHNKPLLTPFYH